MKKNLPNNIQVPIDTIKITITTDKPVQGPIKKEIEKLLDTKNTQGPDPLLLPNNHNTKIRKIII